MKIRVISPPNVGIHWLKALAFNLSTKHPSVEVVDLGLDPRLGHLLRKNRVRIVTPAKPKTVAGKIAGWLGINNTTAVDWDGVVVLSDGSVYTNHWIHRSKLERKSVWIIQV